MNIYRILGFIERVAQYYQGKGYGSASIDSEVRSVKKLLNSGLDIKLAIDIGGNIGQYTDALIKAFPETEVHIFEPQKINIEKLRLKFIEQNNIKIQVPPFINQGDKVVIESASRDYVKKVS